MTEFEGYRSSGEEEPFGFLVFNLARAESADDEKIDRHVVAMARWFCERAKKKHLTYEEALCAAIEFTARFASAGGLKSLKDGDDGTKLAAALANNLKQRILGCFECQAPGKETREQ